ncbi:MAG: hypothetical protein LBS60_10560 [Deltaproteobacteria bacterium]|jgi:hypothetical protein|nr:hypothetical protein [Deltaproteobacteria bacterium]
MSYDYDEVPKLRARDVFQRIFQVFRERLFLILALTLAGEVFIVIGTALESQFINLLGQLIGLAIHGAVALVIFKLYHEEELTFGEAITMSFSKLPSLVLSSVIMFLILMVLVVVISMVVVAVIFTKNSVAIAVVMLACLALVAYIFTIIGMAVPACVVERLGAMDSLRRSAQLTKGCRLSMLLIYFCCLLVALILFVVASSLFIEFFTDFKGLGIKGAELMFERGENLDLGGTSFIIFTALSYLFFQLCTNIINGSIYLELLIVKRDRDLDEMSSVFE